MAAHLGAAGSGRGLGLLDKLRPGKAHRISREGKALLAFGAAAVGVQNAVIVISQHPAQHRRHHGHLLPLPALGGKIRVSLSIHNLPHRLGNHLPQGLHAALPIQAAGQGDGLPLRLEDSLGGIGIHNGLHRARPPHQALRQEAGREEEAVALPLLLQGKRREQRENLHLLLVVLLFKLQVLGERHLLGKAVQRLILAQIEHPALQRPLEHRLAPHQLLLLDEGRTAAAVHLRHGGVPARQHQRIPDGIGALPHLQRQQDLGGGRAHLQAGTVRLGHGQCFLHRLVAPDAHADVHPQHGLAGVYHPGVQGLDPQIRRQHRVLGEGRILQPDGKGQLTAEVSGMGTVLG